MNPLLISFAVLIFFCRLGSSAVTIRVRLSNGAMQRLEVDEETTTIAVLREKLNEIGAIKENDVTFEIGSNKFPVRSSDGASETERTTVKSLGLRAGDILKLIAPNRPVETRERRKPANVTSTPVRSVPAKSSKSLSIADLEKKRQQMVKVTRQKSPGTRSVSITPSAGRILRRISEGGYALLVGKVSIPEEEKEVKKSATQKPPMRGSINTISSAKKAESKGPKETVEVHAVCELFHYGKEEVSPALAAGAETPGDLSKLAVVPVVCDIAKALGMKIVGCAVGVPQPKDHPKKIMWSPSHVFTALQLKQFGEDSKFVVISASSATEETPAADKKARKKKGTSMSADGISIEAFQLSDHAIQMFDKGVLPATRLVDEDKSSPAAAAAAAGVSNKNTGSSSRSSNPLKAGKPVTMTSAALKAMKSDAAKEEEAATLIELAGEALVRNQEVTSVDPYLLSVPLPISALAHSSLEFEHSFPTAAELQEDEKMARLAKQHLHRVLEKLNFPETKARMRDPHLLVHMSSILDAPTRNALCKSVVDGTDRFPGMVKMALDMAKMSLGEDSAIKKRKGHSHEDEDDD